MRVDVGTSGKPLTRGNRRDITRRKHERHLRFLLEATKVWPYRYRIIWDSPRLWLAKKPIAVAAGHGRGGCGIGYDVKRRTNRDVRRRKLELIGVKNSRHKESISANLWLKWYP